MWPFNKKTELTQEGEFFLKTYFGYFVQDLTNRSGTMRENHLKALRDFSLGLEELPEGESVEVTDERGYRVLIKKVKGEIVVINVD